MLSKTIALGIQGIEAQIVDVEVDIIRGLPNFSIVGLPDSTIKESKERIRSAIENSGFEFVPKNFVVNLAPAGFKKQGSAFDLAIAMAILQATNQIDFDPSKIPLVGELSLDGSIKPVKGVISMVIAIYKAGYHKIIVPYQNRKEACAVDGVAVYPVKTIADVVNIFHTNVEPYKNNDIEDDYDNNQNYLDFQMICGQESVKRAVEIAAAGHHNMIMYGPPGSGKTMIARAIPTILPDLSFDESISTTMIHSISGHLLPAKGLLKTPPFRSPHHTSSDVALVGGGKIPFAGEISLAHNGILFLDEFIEFRSNVLQSLRQPLEDLKITVSRAAGSSVFPSDFMLIAASNPCCCGYLFDPEVKCTCAASQIQNYFKKISGPVLDRFDIEIYVPRVPYKQLIGKIHSEPSYTIKKRVQNARDIQSDRFSGKLLKYNSRMSTEDIRNFCPLSPDIEAFYERAAESLNLSARAFFKIIKVARTIADLENCVDISKNHIVEALSYKNLQKYYKI